MSVLSRLRTAFAPSEIYLEVEKSEEEGYPLTRPQRNLRPFLIVSVILNILLSLGFLFTNRTFLLPFTQDPNELLRKTSSYSPLFDKITIPTNEHMVNGSFMDEFDPPNPYRLLPGPEADEAWDRISESGWFFISSDEVEGLGKDPKKVVKAPVEWGYGEDAHLAALDLNHQIHCLNMLRKASFPDHYELPRVSNYQAQHKMHCVDMLRDRIMCTGDAELVTYQWMETQTAPYPDFSIQKKCRDSETLIKWRQDNALRDLLPKAVMFTKPDDIVPEPMPPKLKAWLDTLDEGELEAHIN